jgi:hypothetical protein
MNWEVKNWKPYQKNTLQGFFDLQIGPLLIKGFTFHQKNGKSWAGFPARPELKDETPVREDGRLKHFPIVSVEKAKLADFQDWICKQIAPLLDTSPQPEQRQDDIPF